MANPQVENGYTAIANELMEAFCRINLSAYEHRVLLAILRKTYGYSKKADHIALSQFEKLTGLRRRHIARAIVDLKEKNIILVMPAESRKGNIPTQYALQKNWQEWVVPKEVTLTNTGNSYPQTTKVVPKEVLEGSTYLGDHNNNVKTTTKTKREEKGITENFLLEMGKEFTELDIKDSLKDFNLYWSEGNRKLKRPRFAFRNWLKKARSIKAEGNGNGKGQHLQRQATSLGRPGNQPAGSLSEVAGE